MFQYYPIVLIIQGFCIYHAYKSNADQKWFWLIIFLPLIGVGLYLYDHFYSKEKVVSITEGVKGIVNKNYEIEKLEQKRSLTDSDLNKTNLADKYAEIGMYDKAILLYESCLNGTESDAPDVLKSISYAHYLNKEYADCVKYAEQLIANKEFHKSEEKVGYAWSLYHLGETDKAEITFKEMDARFTNYVHRLAYAQFLNLTDRQEESTTFLNDLLTEFDQMLPLERKDKRDVLNAIKLELKNQES